jgi:hypothetical protein
MLRAQVCVACHAVWSTTLNCNVTCHRLWGSNRISAGRAGLCNASGISEADGGGRWWAGQGQQAAACLCSRSRSSGGRRRSSTKVRACTWQVAEWGTTVPGSSCYIVLRPHVRQGEHEDLGHGRCVRVGHGGPFWILDLGSWRWRCCTRLHCGLDCTAAVM